MHKPAPGPLVNFYAALAKAHNLPGPPSSGQQTQLDGWFLQMEVAISPSVLRQFLQAEICDEPTLSAVIRHYRGNAEWSDKLYVSVAEYLVNCSPKWFQDIERVSIADVAEVLEPVLGAVGELPKWLPELEALITELSAYEHLHELAEHGIFDRGRQLKGRVAKGGLDNMGLVAFARFNYLLRQTFTILWEADIWWIQQAIDELESRSEYFVDCTDIGLSFIEPTGELNRMVHEWKRPSFTEYAGDESYQKVQKLRGILDNGLHQLELA